MLSPQQILKANLETALEYVIDVGKQELVAQGHKATGNLERSFSFDIIQRGDTVKGSVFVEDYGQYVNDGVRASRVRYPIQAIIDWVLDKDITSDENEAERIAWAIKATHQKTGIPSPGSFQFSINGRRKGWIDQMIEQSKTGFDQRLNLSEYLAAVVNNTINELNRETLADENRSI